VVQHLSDNSVEWDELASELQKAIAGSVRESG
jgi:hypothetical protein